MKKKNEFDFFFFFFLKKKKKIKKNNGLPNGPKSPVKLQNHIFQKSHLSPWTNVFSNTNYQDQIQP